MKVIDKVKVMIPNSVFKHIYKECSESGGCETGGSFIGTYRGNFKEGLYIEVSGVIEAGPNAKRSQVSFFKDGEYQERVFRKIESNYPEIEHLGSWHTHHVNGLNTLSNGDCSTYHKNVNSSNHNTDFYYAFLVTELLGENNFKMKHFIVFRDDSREYEIPAKRIVPIMKEILWPVKL